MSSSSLSPPSPAADFAAPPPSLNRLLAGHPLAPLLTVLESQPGAGWVLKSVPDLRIAAHKGQLPHADRSIARQPDALLGCTDAQLFETRQAALLRLADLRVIQQARAGTELHHFETTDPEAPEGSREWAAWRWSLPAEGAGAAPGSPAAWLLTLWLDRQVADRPEAQLRQSQRQMHAQQLLISELWAHNGEAPADQVDRVFREAQERFAQQLRREVDLSRREHRGLALLLLEVDVRGLSESATTTAAALVSRQLASGVRTMDTVAHLGAARFGVLLSGAALTPAFARAEAMRRTVAGQHLIDGDQTHTVSVSIGVAAYSHSARHAEDLMSSAESALEEAVASGGNRCVVARVELGVPPAL